MTVKRKYYIAYGSNLNVWQMQWRCPNATLVGDGMLKGWRLAFRGARYGSHLTVIRSKDDSVPVGIWSVDPDDEKALDTYEGYPRYYDKRNLSVSMTRITGETQTVSAFVYIMTDEYGRGPGQPTQSYWQTCMTGYRHFGFDQKYLTDALRETDKAV